MKNARHFVEYLLARVLLSIIQVLPLSTCQRFACRFAWLATDRLKLRRKVVVENISATYPDMSPEEVDHLIRRMWYHLFMMVCEIAHAPRKIHPTNWRKYIHIRDKKVMTEYLLGARALVLVSGHFGNFEVAGYVGGLLGIPSHAIARPLDIPVSRKMLTRFREANGQFMIPKDGSADRIQEVLEAGGILSILGDQHAGTKGVWIDFLGRPAACHKALALFTLINRAPMMVTYCRRLNQPLQFENRHGRRG